MHGLNPRRCNSASRLSCCIERNTLKVIIVLPTNNDTVEAFENTLTRGFNCNILGCINTRLGFDTKILIPNYSRVEFDQMKIRESFKFYKRRDIKLDAEKKIISSILKLGENNQYSCTMTKPLPTSCNKQQKKVPTWKEFNLML